MRKFQQKMVLELIETLRDATCEIETLFRSGNAATAVPLLADSEAFASKIIQFIEKNEENKIKVISLIREYCEALSAMRDAVEKKRTDIDFSSIHTCVDRIEQSVKTDLKPGKIEVAFFPYKAAMADSLESIWKAALQDPDCDTYVVPIPYYSRSSDGSFAQQHFEGNLYATDTPITDWQEYNVEARHPDIIFVHYPYDADNLSTSVHPNYYCQRLKDYTDLLVYVPYFIAVDDVNETLCVCAGTLYADKVIVQSEKIRQSYIHTIEAYEKSHGVEGAFGDLHNKIQALGSPKIDKVLCSGPADFPLPRDWESLILMPDGTRKKCILFNTTIAALLHGDALYLDKIRYVLDIFRQEKDVVLWWRPHPLNEAIYQSMRPQLLSDYQALIAGYQAEQWGIFDDTALHNRAIAWCDGYYGDMSSLVALYQYTGNPIMIQHTGYLGQRGGHYNQSFFLGLCSIEETWLIMDARHNAVCLIDKGTKEVSYLGRFPQEINGPILYRSCVLHNGKLYFAPCYAEHIAVYDLTDGKFSSVPFPPKSTGKAAKHKFGGVVAWKQYVYFTPQTYPAILRLDTTTHEIRLFTDWLETLQTYICDEEDAYFLAPLLTDHNSIQLACAGGNAVMEFDLDTGRSVVYEVGAKGYGYNGICFDGEDYWLSPRHDTPIVKWHPEKGVIKEYSICKSEPFHKRYCLVPITYYRGYVWVLPFLAKKALKIHVESGELSVADAFQPRFDEHGWRMSDSSYSFCQVEGDTLYAYDNGIGGLLEYNCATGKLREDIITYRGIMNEMVSDILDTLIPQASTCETELDCFYSEKQSRGLVEFIQFIVPYDSFKKNREMRVRQLEFANKRNLYSNGASGIAIYRYCKQITEI